MLFTRSSQTIKQVERGRSCGRVGVAKIRLFWPVWGLASEFYTRQVRVCVLPCSCVFCLLLFVGFQCLLFVFLRAVCCCAVGVYFWAMFWRKLCQFCGSAVLGLLFCGFRVQVGWFHWKQYPLVMFWAGLCRSCFRIVLPLVLGDILRKLCRCRGSPVLGLLCCGFSRSSGLVSLQTISTWGVLGATLSVVFSNRSVTWQFCQMTWGCSIAQGCARVAYCLGSP